MLIRTRSYYSPCDSQPDTVITAGCDLNNVTPLGYITRATLIVTRCQNFALGSQPCGV